MAWMEILGEIFTHTAMTCVTTRDAYGSQTVVRTSNVSCYAFQDSDTMYVAGADLQTIAPRWKVVFQSKDKSAVAVGSVLYNITDQFGDTVLAQAQVVGLTPYRHWSEGLQCVVADLALT